MELEFISFLDPSETKSRESRRKVRSHAMHHVRQRQQANRKRDKYPALQLAPLTQQALCLPPRNFPLIYPNFVHDNEAEEGEQGVDNRGAEMIEQLEAYPVSRSERYIFTIFLHCKSF